MLEIRGYDTPREFSIIMATAADTNILLDVFTPDETTSPLSGELLRVARQRDPLLICDIVWDGSMIICQIVAASRG